MSFKEKPRGSNVTFECSPSGPCVPSLYSEKGDEKYRCSETDYRMPLKCIESEDSVTSSKKTDSEEQRSLLDSSSTSDNKSQAYITYRSCIPASTEDKLSVLSFEGIVILLLLVSGSIIYLRKKKPVSVSGYAAVLLDCPHWKLREYIGLSWLRFKLTHTGDCFDEPHPCFTFVLALISRMEEVHIREYSSQAKVLGTIVSIGGAFVVIFYKGTPIFKNHSSLSSSHNQSFSSSAQSNWIFRGFYFATVSFLASLWYIYQTSVIKSYPCVMVVVFFQILFSTIPSEICALIVVRDLSAWVLRLDMGLVSIFYQVILSFMGKKRKEKQAQRYYRSLALLSTFSPLRMLVNFFKNFQLQS